MAVVSVDLACKSYHDIGIAIIHPEQRAISCEFIPPSYLGLTGQLQPPNLLRRLSQKCALITRRE